MKSCPSTSLIASTAFPTHSSTVSTALIAAASTPVWPTISGFAKLMMITSYFQIWSPLQVSHTFRCTHLRLHIVCRNLRGISQGILSSPLFGSSTPPLKKNVTCAYFSVSAIRACVISWAARYSPNVLWRRTLWNATCLFWIVSSYSVKQTKVVSSLLTLSKPLKSSSQKLLWSL